MWLPRKCCISTCRTVWWKRSIKLLICLTTATLPTRDIWDGNKVSDNLITGVLLGCYKHRISFIGHGKKKLHHQLPKSAFQNRTPYSYKRKFNKILHRFCTAVVLLLPGAPCTKKIYFVNTSSLLLAAGGPCNSRALLMFTEEISQ